ncbi:hypothetical protein [Vibrio neptunius]|uniref:hypothetical protein n=1 Tax=Vibrio neptunius TaxID=170651 RepID=UPI0019D0E9E0|nr:hypothetical protein [Vibrio neptunius]MBN3573534.1 hypothetical protein [Vibrio neptunius]
MKNTAKVSLFLASVCLSTSAISETKSAGQWTTPSKVVSVQIHDNSIFAITTETTDNTSAGCASSNGQYWWPSTDHLSKEIYSSALAAYAAGKRVSVIYTDECNLKSKRLTHLIVKD